MLKFATAQIIAASLGDQKRITRAAHRAVFQYEARPGFLYVRSRAISSRCNDNWDEFPADEIAASYQTFVGKPVFVNHVNDNHRRARGVIIDAALHQDKNPDGTPDTWAEVLMEIDAVRFPKLAKAILAGEVDRTSMGCDVERSVCSACGNEARTPAEYCSHIPHLKGKRIFRASASGKKVGELVRETCYGLRFFENSVLVEPPADPTAHFLGVDATGIGKAAAKLAEFNPADFDSDDPEEDDDEDAKAVTPPEPTQHADRTAPAAPRVPNEGTPGEKKRRQDAVTKSEPYSPTLKPSLNSLQTTASVKTANGDLPVGSPYCRSCNQDLELVRNGHRAAWQHAGGTVTGHEPVPHDGRTFNQEAHRQDEAAMWTPQYPTPNTAQPPRAAALHTQAATVPEVDEYGTPKPKRGQPYEPAGNHPWYKQVPLHHDHIVAHWDKATDDEKDAGMRWYSDAHHVAKAIARLDPRIKTDEEAAHKGAGVLSAYSPRTNWPMNMFNAAHSFRRQAAVRPLKDDPDKPPHTVTMGMHADKAQRIMDGEHHEPVLKAPKTQDFAHLIEHGGYEPQTDDEKAAGAEKRLSDRVVIDRHALSVAAGRRITDVENDAHSGFPGAASGKHARHYYEHAANTYRNAAAAISEKEGKPVAPHQVQAVTWLVRQRLNEDEDQANVNAKAKNAGKGRTKAEENIRGHWKDFAGEHAPQLKEEGNSHVAKVVDDVLINADGTISAVAYGEVKAPADVDTLREEDCPVCGDKDTFDGIQCQICGFINPPDQFRDPDLDKAKNNDLRKQIVDPSLIDNNGELQRVDQTGNAMPQQGDPDAEGLPGQDPDAEQDPDQAQMVDADQLDENGLPPSPYGDQALDGTQRGGPAVSDRNGDGIVQPDEIDPEGNVNVQQDAADPGQGGQAGPRELPGWGKDHTGLPFWPGPDMPDRPFQPDGPDEKLDQDDAPGGRMPQPMMGQPGDGVPDLFCPNCGFGADATPPQTQDMGNPGGAADGIVSGDVCPSCQRAQLLTPGEINSNYSKAPAVERSPWS